MSTYANKWTFAVITATSMAAAPMTSLAGDNDSAEPWSEQAGFQRGEGTPADTGEAGKKCQDISDETLKTECVRKARIKTETEVKKKEIEEEAGNSAEAEQQKAELEEQAKEKEQEVEKAAEEAKEAEKEAQQQR